MFRYNKENDKVIFSQEKFMSDIAMTGDVISTVDGIEIYYHSYTNKVVPPDYEMTDDDKKAEDNGDLVFSRGSDQVYINEVQSVQWMENGLHYNMMQIDGKLSPEELTKMAIEVINK